ncbi:MAG: squalene synthase HpnC [Myxococcota bacterium]|jgi:squalene synthase HpnC
MMEISGSVRSYEPWGGAVETGTGRGWGVEASLRYCTATARGHYENFPVFAPMLDGSQRAALAAIYSFARTADDFADEPVYAGSRLELLDHWERQLDLACAGSASHPVFTALSWAIGRYGLDTALLHDLLGAFRQDCIKHRYESWDELMAYCRRSANPVGRLVLGVLGLKGERHAVHSDCICTALQLANFWQDISVDVPRGRIYLPVDDMAQFGLTEGELVRGENQHSLAKVVRHEAKRTRELFERGRPLLFEAGWPGAPYLAAVWLGGTTILREVVASSDRIRGHRPHVGLVPVLKRLMAGGAA